MRQPQSPCVDRTPDGTQSDIVRCLLRRGGVEEGAPSWEKPVHFVGVERSHSHLVECASCTLKCAAYLPTTVYKESILSPFQQKTLLVLLFSLSCVTGPRLVSQAVAGAAEFPGFGKSTPKAVEQAHSILWSQRVDRHRVTLDNRGEIPTPEDCKLADCKIRDLTFDNVTVGGKSWNPSRISRPTNMWRVSISNEGLR